MDHSAQQSINDSQKEGPYGISFTTLGHACAAIEDVIMVLDCDGGIHEIHHPGTMIPILLTRRCRGKHLKDSALPSALRIQLQDCLERVNAGDSVVDGICTVSAHDCEHWYRYRCVAIPMEGGSSGLSCAIRHLSQDEKRQAANDEDAQRFRGIFENAGVISVQGYDEDRKVIYWNRASEQLYGISRQEALGQRLEDLIIPQDMRDQVVAHVQRWLNEGVPIPSATLTLQRGDGSPITVFSSHVMYRNPQNSRQELYCLDIDFSDRIALEQQLRESLELAQAGSLAKSHFLDTMNHETRTPLNAIIGFASMLEETSLSPEQSEYVGYIAQGGRHLLSLLTDILDLSAIQSGDFLVKLNYYYLHKMIHGIQQQYHPQAVGKGLLLTVEVAHRVPEVCLCDGDRVRQIIDKLVANALKFTHQGSINILLDVAGKEAIATLDEGQIALKVQVSDTGIGIEQSQQESIFTAFTQIESGSSRSYDGMGLSLSMCKKLTERLGGTIHCSSTIGKGSTFTVYLPIEASRDKD